MVGRLTGSSVVETRLKDKESNFEGIKTMVRCNLYI